MHLYTLDFSRHFLRSVTAHLVTSAGPGLIGLYFTLFLGIIFAGADQIIVFGINCQKLQFGPDGEMATWSYVTKNLKEESKRLKIHRIASSQEDFGRPAMTRSEEKTPFRRNNNRKHHEVKCYNCKTDEHNSSEYRNRQKKLWDKTKFSISLAGTLMGENLVLPCKYDDGNNALMTRATTRKRTAGPRRVHKNCLMKELISRLQRKGSVRGSC